MVDACEKWLPLLYGAAQRTTDIRSDIVLGGPSVAESTLTMQRREFPRDDYSAIASERGKAAADKALGIRASAPDDGIGAFRAVKDLSCGHRTGDKDVRHL